MCNPETKATLGTRLRSKTNKTKYTTQKTKMMSSIDSTNRDKGNTGYKTKK